MHPRVILSVGNFFFAISSGLTVYIIFPFLSTLMPAAHAGLVVALGGALALLSFTFLPALVARYGAQEVAIVAGLSEMIALFALAIAPGVVPAALLIILMLALQPFIAYELDLLLEATVTERKTVAEVRTAFLTAWNVGICAAPLLLGALLDDSNAYGRIFIAAGGAFVPFIVLFVARNLPRGVPPRLSHLSDTFSHVVHNRDLSAVTFAHLLLYLFFTWAPLYVPVYLHSVLGIPWTTLGWMFSVILIPYVLIEYPAGWLADRFLGDKKLLFLGFILAGGAFAALGTLSAGSSVSLILTILIISRVGAALIESMTVGHFFRRVSSSDIGSMSFFRGVWPLASIIAPLIGSAILYFGDYQTLFVLTGGFIVIAGALSAAMIKDFR